MKKRFTSTTPPKSNRVIAFIKRLMGKRPSPDIDHMNYCYANGFTAGKNFSYNTGFPIDGNFPWLISVGDNVTLATGVKILAHDASTAKIDGVHTKIGIVDIGNNVFIGCNSIVLCNTRIGDNVVIGAGSVVTRDVPSNSVYGGNPAKFICTFEEYSKKHQDNQHTHPNCREHPWYDWPKASAEDKAKMKEKLKDMHGYL